MSQAAAARVQAQAHYGKYRGVVTQNDDPKDMGRLRARVPEVLGDVPTGWALPCVPYGGDGLGSYLVPPVGSGVWVEFEAGLVSRPIWTGCWWAESRLPKDETGALAKPAVKVLRTDNGLLLRFDDGGKTLALGDGDGRNLVTIEVNAGLVKVLAATKAVVEAPQIELVDGASHPVPFGDNLLQYLNQLVSMFNSHLHPGQMAGPIPVTPAPPVPPFPPATISLLSTRVKAG